MKKVLFLFAVTGILAACNSGSGSSAGNKDSLSNEQKQDALKDSANFTTAVWIDSTFQDIGKVKKGQVVEIPYVIKNTGDKPLIISSVQPGCGCTVGEKTETPILPGKEGKVVAKFNSEGQAEGSHNKNIVVKTNTKPFTETVLYFKAEVVN